MRFEMLPIDMERHNQFATKARAQYFALAETARTGRHHHTALTHTYRGHDIYQCYTAVMTRGVKP